jgi:hypothetical protein
MIYPLGLTIGLRMISRTEAQLGIQGFMQPLPELRSKLSASIRHNLLRHSIQTNYPWHIQLCQLWSRVGHLDMYKVGYHGQSIDNYPDGTIPWLSPRQTHNKIHGNFFPHPLGVLVTAPPLKSKGLSPQDQLRDSRWSENAHTHIRSIQRHD